MNTDAEEDDDSLRYAEYALGVLDADARAAVAREIDAGGEAAAAVAAWQGRLTPLTDEIGEAAPAPYVWTRIHSALRLDALPRPRQRKGMWDSLALWRWIAIGTSIVAAGSVALVVTQPHWLPTRAAVSTGYMVSAIQQDNGVTGWTATMDLEHARMVVVPATPAAITKGRSTQLWLIPEGGKPISVGVITREKSTALTLDPAMLARLGPTAVLAVSVEPLGGSPTGQPTGPVIAKGVISAAADASA